MALLLGPGEMLSADNWIWRLALQVDALATAIKLNPVARQGQTTKEMFDHAHITPLLSPVHYIQSN